MLLSIAATLFVLPLVSGRSLYFVLEGSSETVPTLQKLHDNIDEILHNLEYQLSNWTTRYALHGFKPTGETILTAAYNSTEHIKDDLQSLINKSKEPAASCDRKLVSVLRDVFDKHGADDVQVILLSAGSVAYEERQVTIDAVKMWKADQPTIDYVRVQNNCPLNPNPREFNNLIDASDGLQLVTTPDAIQELLDRYLYSRNNNQMIGRGDCSKDAQQRGKFTLQIDESAMYTFVAVAGTHTTVTVTRDSNIVNDTCVDELLHAGGQMLFLIDTRPPGKYVFTFASTADPCRVYAYYTGARYIHFGFVPSPDSDEVSFTATANKRNYFVMRMTTDLIHPGSVKSATLTHDNGMFASSKTTDLQKRQNTYDYIDVDYLNCTSIFETYVMSVSGRDSLNNEFIRTRNTWCNGLDPGMPPASTTIPLGTSSYSSPSNSASTPTLAPGATIETTTKSSKMAMMWTNLILLFVFIRRLSLF